MCWYNNELNKKVADRDIPIFKIMKNRNGRIVSYYWSFLYELNKVYTTEIHHKKNVVTSLWEINNGFHSYDINSCKVAFDDLFMQIRYITSPVAYLVLDSLTIFDFVLVKGYIPKGTIYYLNKKGEYVSQNIVLTKIMNKDGRWFRIKRRIKKLFKKL